MNELQFMAFLNFNFICTFLRSEYAVDQVFESTRVDYFTGLIQIVQIHELSKKIKSCIN